MRREVSGPFAITASMDDEQKQKHAPWRNKRYAHLRGFNEEADWADTLDWKANDYDFYRLVQSLFARLDSEYREWGGLRIDQLASREDLSAIARSAASRYRQEEHRYSPLGIYVYLHCTLDLDLLGRARKTLERRRELAEDLAANTPASHETWPPGDP